MKKLTVLLIIIFCIIIKLNSQNNNILPINDTYQNLNSDDFVFEGAAYHVLFNIIETHYELTVEKLFDSIICKERQDTIILKDTSTKEKIVFYNFKKDIFTHALICALIKINENNNISVQKIKNFSSNELQYLIDIMYDNFSRYNQRYELLFRLGDEKEQAGIFEFTKTIDINNISSEVTIIDLIKKKIGYLEGLKGESIKKMDSAKKNIDTISDTLKDLKNDLSKLEVFKVSNIFFRNPQKYINKTILKFEKKKTINCRVHRIINSVSKDIYLGTFSSDFVKSGINDIAPGKIFSFNTENFSNNNKSRTTGNVRKIKLLIKDGSIKDIEAVVGLRNNSNQIVFSNYLPIPLQTKLDIAQLNKKILLPKNPGSGYYLKLIDLLNYETYGGNLSNDYSPEDQYIEINEENWQSKIKVNKFGLNDYLNIKVYSDLVGLSNEKPNGLLQFETAIRMPIKGIMIPNSKFALFEDIGWFINFLKIEESDKVLSNTFYGYNSNFGEGKIKTNNINTLDLLNYANFGTGLNLGVTRFRTPNKIFEYSMDINGGIFSNKALDDSLKSVENLTSFLVCPKINILIKPGSNIGLDLSFGFTYIQLCTQKQFTQTSRNLSNIYETFNSPDDLKPSGKWTYSPSLTAYFYPLGNKYNKIYMRAVLHKMIVNTQNILQIQVGYALSISDFLSRNKYKGNVF